MSEHETVARLLTQLATALNECAVAGVSPRLRHDTVYTNVGYVLLDENDRWVARTLTHTGLEPADWQDDDDD